MASSSIGLVERRRSSRPGGRAVPLLVACLAVACGDEAQVRVVVKIPEAYRNLVVGMRLRLVVPPSSDPFDCDALAFSQVDERTLRLSVMQEVSGHLGDGVPMVGIARAGTKLFWAEGLDNNNQTVVAGCASLGKVGSETVVNVDTETSTHVFLSGSPTPTEEIVFVLDSSGQPLAGTPVRWIVVGSQTSIQPFERLTNDSGVAIFSLLEIPSQPMAGPLLVASFARWQRNKLMNRSSFAPPANIWTTDSTGGTNSLNSGLPGNALSYVIGHIGPANTPGGPSVPGFAVLLAESTGRSVHTKFNEPHMGWNFVGPVLDVGLNAEVIGLVSAGASGDQKIVVVAGNEWLEIPAIGQPSPPIPPKPLSRPPNTQAIGFHSLPCASPPAGRAAICFESNDADHKNTIWVYDDFGNKVWSPLELSFPTGIDVLTAGCVAATPGSSVPTYPVLVTYEASGTDPNPFAHTLHVAVENSLISTSWRTHGLGIFIDPSNAGLPFVGAFFTSQSIYVGRHRISNVNIDPAGIDLEVIMQDATMALPQATGLGHFDSDEELDMVALIPMGLIAPDPQNAIYQLLIVLGATYQGERIAGAMNLPEMKNPRLAVMDFDGDGIDDIFLGEQDVDNTSNILVLRMGYAL